MKLIAASRDGERIDLSFDRPEGRLDIFCLPRWRQIPSCDLWLGVADPSAAAATSIAPSSAEQSTIERLLEQWLEEHLHPRIRQAFETPGMHIRLTDNDTRAYFVWRVFDHLRGRHLREPERWTKIAESIRNETQT